MKEFWTLVRNNQRRGHDHESGRWKKFYIITFLILLLAGYSLSIYRGNANPATLLIGIPYLNFISFGISVASIKHEWKGQTAAWWLTLPYSRLELLLAKFVANFLRFIRIMTAAIVILAVLAVEGMLLSPNVWTISTLGNVAQAAYKLCIVVIAVSPAAITLGMFLATIINSRLKPFTPIVWAILVSLLITASNNILHLGSFIRKLIVSPSPEILSFTVLEAFTLVLVPLALSAVLLGISSYILAEQTEV